MNVDEAMKVARQEVLGWYDDIHTAGPVLATEVERLRAQLSAAKAAGVISNDEQDCEQIAIKGMSHFYGDLWILHDGDEYFWRLDDYNGGEWQPISKQLYEALRDHNRQDRTPPAT